MNMKSFILDGADLEDSRSFCYLVKYYNCYWLVHELQNSSSHKQQNRAGIRRYDSSELALVLSGYFA